LAADTETASIKSVGVGLLGFSDAFHELIPDIVVLLGDRFELFAPAISALMQKIPIAHIHGGETSQGAVDEAVRHAITKMAAIHFPATEAYRQRIIQMGEQPERVFMYGAPGLDNIYRLKLLEREELAALLQFELTPPTAIVTYHPVSLEHQTAEPQIMNLLQAIAQADLRAIFTQANAEPQGRIVNQRIDAYCRAVPNRYKFVANLGQVAYLSCLTHCDLMIGNSSSGLIEAPSFKLPVVNIGDRQKGRLKAANVINTGYEMTSIKEGIDQALSPEFKLSLQELCNPYEANAQGNASFQIKEVLKSIKLDETLLKKTFRDSYADAE